MTVKKMETDSVASESTLKADETFSTLESSPELTVEEDDEVGLDLTRSSYSEFPATQTFSGSNWLNDAVEDLRSNPQDWRPVPGVEDRFLDLKELYVGRRFASGASGRLYEGKYRGREVAVKILRTPASETDRKKLDSEFKQEVSLLSSVSHPNIMEVRFTVNYFPILNLK